jgi:hypothetical protein
VTEKQRRQGTTERIRRYLIIEGTIDISHIFKVSSVHKGCLTNQKTGGRMEQIVRLLWGAVLHRTEYGQYREQYEKNFALILGVYREVWSRIINYHAEPILLSVKHTIDPQRQRIDGVVCDTHRHRLYTKQDLYLVFRYSGQYPEIDGYTSDCLNRICSFPLRFGGHVFLASGAEPTFVTEAQNVWENDFFSNFTIHLEQEVLRVLDAGPHRSRKKTELHVGWQEVMAFFEQSPRPLALLEMLQCFGSHELPSKISALLPKMTQALADWWAELEERHQKVQGTCGLEL